jgi:hypothetical protein
MQFYSVISQDTAISQRSFFTPVAIAVWLSSGECWITILPVHQVEILCLLSIDCFSCVISFVDFSYLQREVFFPKKNNPTPNHITQPPKMADLLPYDAPPLGFFWQYLSQKSSYKTGTQTQLGARIQRILLSCAVAHLPRSQQHRHPFDRPLFFFYRTIIITKVDDNGMIILLHNHPDSGRQCRGSSRGIRGVERHSGREEWPQLDCHNWQKNHGEFGGDSTIIYCTHCRRLFLFSPYSNYHSFKFIWMPVQWFKWQHTTHATT